MMTEADKGATKEGCGHAVVERVCTIIVVDFSFISRRGRSKITTCTVGGDERGIKSRC